MKLYYTVISAFSRKCRILARELNIIHGIQEVITTMRSTDSIIMSINQTGKVPALITNEEQLITESSAICTYWEKIAKSNIKSVNFFHDVILIVSNYRHNYIIAIFHSYKCCLFS